MHTITFQHTIWSVKTNNKKFNVIIIINIHSVAAEISKNTYTDFAFIFSAAQISLPSRIWRASPSLPSTSLPGGMPSSAKPHKYIFEYQQINMTMNISRNHKLSIRFCFKRDCPPPENWLLMFFEVFFCNFNKKIVSQQVWLQSTWISCRSCYSQRINVTKVFFGQIFNRKLIF